MRLPPQLESDIDDLRKQGYRIASYREPPDANQIRVVIDGYPLPKGWSKNETRLLLLTDVSYPNSRLDMFWVDADLRLKDGRIPEASNAVDSHLGTEWRRVSWHVKKWNPAVDDIISFLRTIDARLRQLR
jgi:Prokaryotic E2 family E